MSGCLLSRLYVIPTNNKAYNVHGCGRWMERLNFNITLSVNDVVETKRFVLPAGRPETWKGIKVTPTGFFMPPMALSPPAFLSEGGRIAYLSEADLKKTRNLRCHSYEDAVQINCRFNQDLCSVHPDIDTTEYHCADTLALEDILENPRNMLPMQNGGQHFSLKEGEIVTYPEEAMAHLQVVLQGFKLTAKADLNSIKVTKVDVEGCYSCSLGALVKIRCQTDYGTAMAHVTCPSGFMFPINCDSSATEQEIRLHSQRAEIDEECEATAVSALTKFRIQAHLQYVAEESGPMNDISDRTGPIQLSKTSGRFDLKNLLYLIFEDWIHTGIYVLVFVGGVVLVCLFGKLMFCCYRAKDKIL